MIHETSDAWSTSHLSHRPSEPQYYSEDCQILDLLPENRTKKEGGNGHAIWYKNYHNGPSM
jgi:hypothetical protein